jgi:hypothetical protein
MMVQILPEDLSRNRMVGGPMNSQPWGRIVARAKLEMLFICTHKRLRAELIHRVFSRDLSSRMRSI